MNLKRELSLQYNAPMSGTGLSTDTGIRKARSNASALKFGTKIPPHRRLEIRKELNLWLGVDQLSSEINSEELDRILSLDPVTGRDSFKSHGQIVVETIGSDPNLLYKFVIMWRKHFLEILNPKFMNKHWNVNRTLA